MFKTIRMQFVELFAILAVISFVLSLIFLGVINLVHGYKRDKDGHFNNSKLVTGWTILGIISALFLVAFFCLFIWPMGGSVFAVMLIIFAPVIVIGGFIALLSSGIVTLVKGIKKSEEGKRELSRIVPAILLLTAALLIVLSVAALFIYFATHPIAFM